MCLILVILANFGCSVNEKKEKALEVNKNSLFILGDGHISSFNTTTNNITTIETPRFVDDFCFVNNKILLAIFPLDTPSKLSLLNLEGKELKTVDPPHPGPIITLHDGKHIIMGFAYVDKGGSKISILDEDLEVTKEIAIPDLAEKLSLDSSGRMFIKYYDNSIEDYCLGIIEDFIFTKLPLKSGNIINFEFAPNGDIVTLCEYYPRKYTLEVFDKNSLEKKSSILLDSLSLDLAIKENRIYVLSKYGNLESTITVINMDTQAIEQETNIPFAEDLFLRNEKLYLPSITEKSLTILDINSGELESIPLGYEPYTIKEFNDKK